MTLMQVRLLRITLLVALLAATAGLAWVFTHNLIIALTSAITAGLITSLLVVDGWFDASDVRDDLGRPLRPGRQMDNAEIERHLRSRGRVVIDDDPTWGLLVEGRDQNRWLPFAAVQVTNATPEPDGTYRKYWLRVPTRGERQGQRNCLQCKRDIAWPPRTAKEAIAWTFNLCPEHYQPTAAS